MTSYEAKTHSVRSCGVYGTEPMASSPGGSIYPNLQFLPRGLQFENIWMAYGHHHQMENHHGSHGKEGSSCSLLWDGSVCLTVYLSVRTHTPTAFVLGSLHLPGIPESYVCLHSCVHLGSRCQPPWATTRPTIRDSPKLVPKRVRSTW